ncbi:MAG: hypothetical protein EHM55_20450 [Acidobacteria bacterium]|nr:MAG: hypothetical protein EHM55_20450 [Acidobacteriota bacterium]
MLRRVSRHGDNRDRDLVARRDRAELADVEYRHPGTRALSNLRGQRIEQCDDLKPFLLKPGIIGEGEPQVSRAENGDFEAPIESENLAEVLLEILDVIAHAAHAELPEVRQVFPDLRRVEMKLLLERLR